jgi:hypothetical protein
MVCDVIARNRLTLPMTTTKPGPRRHAKLRKTELEKSLSRYVGMLREILEQLARVPQPTLEDMRAVATIDTALLNLVKPKTREAAAGR